MSRKVAVYRKEHFNAAHRLFNSGWSDERNLEVFGKCSYPNYHGHNYELIVKVVGPVNPDTGYVMDMKVLSDLIWKHALHELDHRNLNLDTPYFATVNPTAENIVVVLYELIRPHIPADCELSLRLYETERNFVSYPA
jgi:6-pyruvoyltetrahydropterin/6-carboxytetrahydropterin synthase